MGEGQVRDIGDSFRDIIAKFNGMDEDDAAKMALCLNILVFRLGYIDGTYGPDSGLYRFVMAHYDDIDRYLYFIGFRLLGDDLTRQAWIAPLLEDDGRLYAPFTAKSMTGAQMVLLAVLQKRLATGSSSDNTGADSSTGVLLTETDIMKDMFPYIPGKEDEKYKRDSAVAAINVFCTELGLLRLVSARFPLPDGTYSKVYRISPFIQHQFDIMEMERLYAAFCEEAGKRGISIEEAPGVNNSEENVSGDNKDGKQQELI